MASSADLTPGDQLQRITIGGRNRTYLLHLPKTFSPQRQYALVVNFHGGGGNAQITAEMSHISELADEKEFIVVYPNGSGRQADRLLTWNATHCCGFAFENQIDDVGFVRELVKQLNRELPIDPKRIFATGLSNGAMFTYRVGAEMADVFAAIAPVAGTIGGWPHVGEPGPLVPSKPQQSVAVIVFHGKLDRHVLYAGGQQQVAFPGQPPDRVDISVADSINFWVEANGCPTQPQRQTLAAGRITVDSWSGCTRQADIVLYSLEEQGHAWPGGKPAIAGFSDSPNSDIDATRLIWEFFATHPKG